MTEDEFDKMIKNHPTLKISKQTKKQIQKEENKETIQKPNKYHNVKVYEYEDGYFCKQKNMTGHGKLVSIYDSTKEFARWGELKILENAKIIKNLERQKELLIQEEFKYQEKKISKIAYKADFIYEQNGVIVVEDAKTFDEVKQRYIMTEAFKIKWKLLKKKYPDYNFRLY